jgi:septal ring factor EnvC (AmiA/AmiB activator)
VDDTVELEPVRDLPRTALLRRNLARMLLAAGLLLLAGAAALAVHHNLQVARDWQHYSHQVVEHAEQLETLLDDAIAEIDTLAAALRQSEADVRELERIVVELSGARDRSDDQYAQLWVELQKATSRNRHIEACLSLLDQIPLIIAVDETGQIRESVDGWLHEVRQQRDRCRDAQPEQTHGGLP